jgi:hypothetical protein
MGRGIISDAPGPPRNGGVGREVDQDVVGGDEKKIIARDFEELFALAARGLANGFDALDREWLDDVLAIVRATRNPRLVDSRMVTRETSPG